MARFTRIKRVLQGYTSSNSAYYVLGENVWKRYWVEEAPRTVKSSAAGDWRLREETFSFDEEEWELSHLSYYSKGLGLLVLDEDGKVGLWQVDITDTFPKISHAEKFWDSLTLAQKMTLTSIKYEKYVLWNALTPDQQAGESGKKKLNKK